MTNQRRWPSAYIIPALLVLVGGLIFAYGSRFPQYTDPNWEVRLNENQRYPHWYEARKAVQTLRDPCHDLGAGILILGPSLAVLFLAQGVRKLRDIANLATPKTHRLFYLLATLIWLSFIPAELYFYYYTTQRGDYPSYADIPIPEELETIFGFLALPVILLGVSMAIHSKKLPCSIWSPVNWRHLNFTQLGIWFALFLALLVLAMGVTMRPPIVPSALFTLYLLLSGRAVAAS